MSLANLLHGVWLHFSKYGDFIDIIIFFIWRHYYSYKFYCIFTTSFESLLWRHTPLYCDVTLPSTVPSHSLTLPSTVTSHPPLLCRHTPLYSPLYCDVTLPSTVISLSPRHVYIILCHWESTLNCVRFWSDVTNPSTVTSLTLLLWRH